MIAFIPATAHTTLAAGARTTPFPARGNGQSLLPHTIHGGPAPQLCLTPGPSPAPRRPLTSAGQKALDPPPPCTCVLLRASHCRLWDFFLTCKVRSPGCQVCHSQIYNPMTSSCLNPLPSYFSSIFNFPTLKMYLKPGQLAWRPALKRGYHKILFSP